MEWMTQMESKSNVTRGWMSPPETWSKLRGSARDFQRMPTPAEKKLWDAIRSRKVNGARFRRQHAIDRFIVDFYCAEAMLVIEVDGPVHDARAEQDSIRQRHLEQLGLRFLRFSNEDVLKNLNAVVARIAEAVA